MRAFLTVAKPGCFPHYALKIFVEIQAIYPIDNLCAIKYCR